MCVCLAACRCCASVCLVFFQTLCERARRLRDLFVLPLVLEQECVIYIFADFEDCIHNDNDDMKKKNISNYTYNYITSWPGGHARCSALTQDRLEATKSASTTHATPPQLLGMLYKDPISSFGLFHKFAVENQEVGFSFVNLEFTSNYKWKSRLSVQNCVSS